MEAAEGAEAEGAAVVPAPASGPAAEEEEAVAEGAAVVPAAEAAEGAEAEAAEGAEAEAAEGAEAEAAEGAAAEAAEGAAAEAAEVAAEVEVEADSPAPSAFQARASVLAWGAVGTHASHRSPEPDRSRSSVPPAAAGG
ncbi:hypothetical protein GCM10011505_07620 [Tistrella bauzanensis]|uniref:Uncharacterized protein n=1 Tax=Tistrella bauzanensis TaxID=657419 RepID=A0ABQ1IB15_9PROT|nr:hypothetical protein GCM10011505_07620 [Tistrella bauzanensis]